ncbi:MAG: bifunctional phosphopantothenoylcysteine decarboxylase/phosphopantothenate--cysteine ligase CoaBC [Alistipes sp.]|nr:bifunctional phosphopantothenoylcysteine decarboxylase/phosphopantothenate--cysteine ligase CoaBC [Alistipes sp.]
MASSTIAIPISSRTMLKGKHILLGVTGSIAAYKAAVLCRLLRNAGAEVQVVMTATAKQFITPLTMATLSKNPIIVEFFNPENGEWNSHISLGEWADCYVIAPATANTIAKMATGVADNLLLTTYLSARCKTIVAPAMDCDMFAHITTQTNLTTLRNHGVVIADSPAGELASGLTGKGRMAEPEQILDLIAKTLNSEKKKSLQGKHFVVTAGATIEAIDPVRYITNHSTGKMGYAIAKSLAERGAEVTLVTGRTALATPAGVKRVDVLSAADMYRAATEAFATADGAIMCAAVADYTPAKVAEHKIKKSDDDMAIELVRTKDIAAALGAVKGDRLLVGFALESDEGVKSAQSKLKRKNLDFIVLNSLTDKGAGFGVDTNKVTFIDNNGSQSLPLMSKSDVAESIVHKIEQHYAHPTQR